MTLASETGQSPNICTAAILTMEGNFSFASSQIYKFRFSFLSKFCMHVYEYIKDKEKGLFII